MKERATLPRVLARPILAALVLLTLLAATCAYALMPAAPFKPFVALGIAVVKASVVMTVFMRLLGARGVVLATAAIAIAWLALMFGLAWIDYASR